MHEAPAPGSLTMGGTLDKAEEPLVGWLIGSWLTQRANDVSADNERPRLAGASLRRRPGRRPRLTVLGSAWR